MARLGISNLVTKFVKWNELKKVQRMQDFMKAMIGRSTNPANKSTGSFLYPKFPYHVFDLYELSYTSDTLSTVHRALRQEIFRNGFELLNAKETGADVVDSENFSEATGLTDRQILDFLENCNANKQKLLEVLEELEDDFNIMDDAFLMFSFDYDFDSNGDVINKKLLETYRADPRTTGPILDQNFMPGMRDGKVLYFSPFDRTVLLEDQPFDHRNGVKNFRAFYFADSDNGNKIYYSAEEVVHKSKYRPSKGRGQSPVLTLWQKVRTLLYMDKYIMELYDGQRPPKAGLFFKTSNQAGLRRMWDEAVQKATENPHLPIAMGVPDSSNGQGFVEFVDFMKGLTELQHTEMRNEYRTAIGGYYGVTPIFQADISNGGGLNNEGLQVTVTNRAAEHGQKIYNEHYLPKLLEALGVRGKILKLRPSEEQDENAKLERIRLALENGERAVKLGLTAKYLKDSEEIVIEDGDLEKPEVTSPFDSGFNNETYKDDNREGPKPKMSGAPLMKSAESDFAKLLKEEVAKAVKKLGRKPSATDLHKLTNEINRKLVAQMKAKADVMFEQHYKQVQDKVGKDMGINVLFDTQDQNVLVALTNQKVLSDSFVKLTDEMTDGIRELLTRSLTYPNGIDANEIIKEIENISGVAESRAETIARTEMGKVEAAARKNSYSKEGDLNTMKFKWIGPNDHRTTSTSKRIKSRVGKGVHWEELVRIVSEESAKDYPGFTVDKDFPISHYNSRHIFVRTQD